MKLHKIRKITRGGGRLAAFLFAVPPVFAAGAAETVVEYVAPASGTASQSLADGKVQVVYDAEDKITRLAISPSSGETLVLHGDALPFADGAAIVPGSDGESVVSNAVSFAGAVSLGIKNLSWSGTLSSSDYTTVFENANLDDISPVSATVGGAANMGLPETGVPYYVERTGSGSSAVMTVQFQTDKGGLLNNDGSGGTADQTKVVRVEFAQDGVNVKAKITHTGYFNRTRLHGFDITKSLNAAANQVALTANISSIEFGPRYEYFFYNTELTTTDAVVAENANVEDIEILYLLHSNDYVYMPYHVSCENGVLTAQMIQQYNAIQCAKIQLSQSGSDVVAKILYTKKLSEPAWGSTEPPDFDEAGNAANLTGFKGLAFRQKVKPRKLTFIASSETTLNAVAGGNVDVTFKTLAADAPVPTTIKNIYPYLGTAKTLVENANLATMTVTGATFGGPKWNGSDWVVVDFANNGSTASFQIQCHRENLLQCMDVELLQNGADVEIKTTAAFYAYWADYADEYYNKKTFPLSLKEGEWAANALATSDTGNNRFNLDDLTYTLTPKAFVYATGANTLADSSLAFYGAENNSLDLHVTAASAFNAACPFDCYAGTTMYIDDVATYNTGVVTGMTQTMHSGSVLVTPQKFAFSRQSGKLVLDGATLLNTADEAYFNYIAFSNAAVVASASGDLRAGGKASPVWNVGGTGMSSLEGNIELVKIADAPSLTIDVAEVADGTDFLVAGDIVDLQANNPGYLVKTGAGTMQLDGAAKSIGGVLSIAEGTLLLGASSNAHTDFSLDGGALALAAGTANEAATLYVTEDSSLIVGDGATLVLSDVVVSEGATLNVAGAGRSSLQVTGTLTGATLSRIRIDGNRTRQDADGYLRRNCGFIISFL